MTPTFYGRVESGKLKFRDTNGWLRRIASLEGQEIEVRLGKLTKNRSNAQNSFFHGVICELLSEYTGYSPEEAKEILKQKFLLVGDGPHAYCRPTSSLSTAEMATFNERCIQFCAELGVVIPDPKEAYV